MAHTHDELNEAIAAWREQATLFAARGNSAMARSCERTAQALEIERDTGVAVCSCCHKPFSAGVRV
jgi:cytochrome c553